MSLRSCITVWLPLVCAAVLITSCKDANVDLRFVPDNDAMYELAYEGSGSSLLDGKAETHTTSLTWILRTTKDSNATGINATYKRFSVNLNTSIDSISMDTERPVADSVALHNSKKLVPWVWQGVKGLSFDFKINTLGKIESVASFTPLLNNLVKKVLKDSAASNNEMFSTVWDIAASQFTAPSVQNLLQHVFPEYPGNPLKVGDTLTRTFKYHTGLPLIVVQIFKIADITDTQVTMMMGGSGFLEDSNEHKIKAEQQGKIVVNRKTGVMETAYIEEVITGTLGGQPFKQNAIIKASCRKIGLIN